MRLLPFLVSLLCLSSLFISFPPQHVEANSLGVGIPCDVANPILGSDDQKKPGANDPVRAMWWTKRPAFAGNNRYTLRTSDTGTQATDPTTYVPGQWVDLHLRTLEEDRQFNGLLMYAENAAGKKVGEWFIAPRQDFRVDPTSGCVTHKNADRKQYYSNFRVKFPAGTGTVTIKALIKYGLAFPALEGLFLYPNDKFLTLTEAPAQATAWFQGAVGESCNTVCRKQNLGCDVNAMKQAMTTPNTWYDSVKKVTQCTLPLMRGCSSATPSVGDNGCYYHDDTCTRLPVTPVWERADPCAGLAPYTAGTNYDKTCCRYQDYKWCSRYFTSGTPQESQYGPWAKVTPCMPAGGYPQEAAPVLPPPRTAAQIDCATIFSSPLDGNRICACAGAAVPGSDPPTQPPSTSGPLVTTATTTAPPATLSPREKACNAPRSIDVTSNGLAYQFSHIPGVDNPRLYLVEGVKYSFNLDASIKPGNHPFAIKNKQSTGASAEDMISSMYVTNNNAMEGTVSLTFTSQTNEEIYYQCSIHPSMTNVISFVEASECGGTTAAPITTTTKSPTTTSTAARVTTTTTNPPNSCAVINCGPNGFCSFGSCQCQNGYTGTRCETAPAVTCNVNCKSLNRGTCTTNNQCGACLEGYTQVGVNCVLNCNTADCAGKNRLTCTAPNTCGACTTGFVEPTANNKNVGLSCVSAAAPATTSAPNVPTPAPNPNGYKFEIGAQWQSGFCGTVSGAVDPNNMNVEFMLPTGLTLASTWNLGASYDPATGLVTGTLPDWAKYGQTFSGGLCANFAYDPEMLIQTNNIGFTAAKRSAKSLASLQDIDKYDVVIAVKLKNTITANLMMDDKFVTSIVSEAAKLIGVKPVQVSFLRYDPTDSASVTLVSFNVHCSSSDQISLAVAFPENLKNLQALTANQERASDYVALYPNLYKADASSVGMTFPTELYADNSAAETPAQASSASQLSVSIITIFVAAFAYFARW